MSIPKLCMSRSICSFGSCIDDDGRVTTTEQMLSAVPAIQRCLLICGIVYRLEGSNTNILRIRLSQSAVQIANVNFDANVKVPKNVYFNKHLYS